MGIGVGALGLGCSLWLLARPSPPERTQEQPPQETHLSAPVPPETAPLSLPKESALDPKERLALTAARDEHAALLKGSLRIEETDGSITTTASGELEFMLWNGGSGSGISTKVADGRWELQLDQLPEQTPEALAGLELEPKWFNDRDREVDALPTQWDTRISFANAAPTITFQRARGLTLTVLDAETRARLDAVSVTTASSWGIGNPFHPSSQDPTSYLVSSQAAPLEVMPNAWVAHQSSARCFVGARGYAWKAVKLDFRNRVDKQVLLEPGADLTIHLDPAVKTPGAALRLHPADGSSPMTSPATGGATLVLSGLTPGPYTAAIELGEWYLSPLDLGQAEVELQPGEHAEITIQTHAPPELVTAPLRGRLLIPREWGFDPPALNLKLLDPALDRTRGYHQPRLVKRQAQTGNLEVFEFDFSELQTGSYELTLGPLDYSLSFELPVEGLLGLVFEIPPPVEIFVVVTDGTTGAVAPIERLSWYPERGPTPRGWSSRSATRPAGSERFQLRVPRCPISLSTTGEEFTRAEARVDAREGLEVALTVRPASTAIIHLWDGETPIDWPGLDIYCVKSIDGQGGHFASIGGREGSLWFSVTRPGTYSVTPPKVEGYQDHEPVEVVLIEGELTEVSVELVPR